MVSYVISLDKRVERWYYVREHLHDMDIHPIRFAAIETKLGWQGCRDSHIAILSKMQEGDVYAIYEDDVMFLESWDAVLRSISQLPVGWDCLYLGASPKEPQVRFSDNLFRLKNAHVTHAIVWNYRHYGAVEYIMTHISDIKKWDVYLAEVIQPKFNCFVTYPLVATQKQFKSDTCTRSDVSQIEKNYNFYCK
jgi:GR25 family glycosyltransferase involved in LPS biosynthesis